MIETALTMLVLPARVALRHTGLLAQGLTAAPMEEVLQLSWPFPIWVTVGLVALLAMGVAALYWSERGKATRRVRCLLALLRFLLLALILWMMAGWSWLRFKTDRPELLIAIDRSASMQTRDAGPTFSPGEAPTGKSPAEGPSRFQRAAEILNRFVRRNATALGNRYQMRWLALAETADALEAPGTDALQALGKVVPDGQQSKLGDCLTSLLQRQAGRPTAAVVLLSDGITTGGGSLLEAANKARTMAVPIYCIALGRELSQPDVRLADLLVDDTVFLGDEVQLQLTLLGADVGNVATQVTLKNAGSAEVLDSAKVELTRQQNQQQVRLRFIPKQVGEIGIRLEASQVPGETNVDNNLIERTITVRDQTIRVLLVQRSPGFEFRFLKNLLTRTTQPGNADVAAFELHSVLQEADASYVEQDNAAIRLPPSDRETLAKYDVFVFGEFDPALVSRSSQNAIVEQVSSSGSGLMFVSGRGASLAALQGWPLTSILPVDLEPGNRSASGDPVERFFWQPTTLGQSALPLQLVTSEERNLQLWRQLPGPQWIEQLGDVKPAAQVLATAQSPSSIPDRVQPLLVSHFAGAGRVVVQATDETYRWINYAGGDLYYQRYWIQMMRWLSRGRLAQGDDQAQLVVEPRRSKFGDPVRVTARLRPADVAAAGPECRVLVEQLDGQSTTLALPRVAGAPNQYQLTKSDFLPGAYRAVIHEAALDELPHATFAVVAPPGEQANLKVDLTTLKAVAERTRGKFYLANEASALFNDLPPGNPVRLGALPPQPIWNSPWVALLFVLLITSEWLMRRACRMF